MKSKRTKTWETSCGKKSKDIFGLVFSFFQISVKCDACTNEGASNWLLFGVTGSSKQTCILSVALSRQSTPLPATFLLSTIVLSEASRLMCLALSVAKT